MQSPNSPSSTTSSSPSDSDTEAAVSTDSEDVLTSLQFLLQRVDDLAEAEIADEEDETFPPPPLSPLPNDSEVDHTETELPPAGSSDSPQLDSVSVVSVNSVEGENDNVVTKKDASTQTEIFATETNVINSTATLTSTVGTGGIPFISGQHPSQHPLLAAGMATANKQYEVLNTALDHTVFDYNNLNFMNEEKNASNDDCCSESANQWRDSLSADYDDDRRDHAHQNPCPCFIPGEPEAVSAVPQWYHPPMQMPNYAPAAQPNQIPTFAQPAQPAQISSYPQASPLVQMPPCPPPSGHPMQQLPAYQYHPPYSNYGMFYNNNNRGGSVGGGGNGSGGGGCYYPNSSNQTRCGHPPCCDEERPYWWNMNGRRWPDSRDDLCSLGCGRRRRCRREFYLETPRPRPRTLPVKTIVKETAGKNDDLATTPPTRE